MSLILALDALHITFTHLTPISSVNCIHHTPDLGSTAASTLVHSWTTSVLPALVILISVFIHYFVWQHFFLNFAFIHEAYTLHCQQLLAVTVLHFTNIWESKRWKRKPKDDCTSVCQRYKSIFSSNSKRIFWNPTYKLPVCSTRSEGWHRNEMESCGTRFYSFSN